MFIRCVYPLRTNSLIPTDGEREYNIDANYCLVGAVAGWTSAPEMKFNVCLVRERTLAVLMASR